MENSKIEWTDHTFNPWIGCQAVSPGCDFCYAEELMANRYQRVVWGPHGERQRTSPGNWREPLKWAAKARGALRRPRVFCASLADVFDNQAREHWRADLWDLIMVTPELDWLLLTKRPENIPEMTRRWSEEGWPANVWLGVSAENQETFDRRAPKLLAIPARVHFLSLEPLLGPISLGGASRFSWVIVGGESGAKARPMHLDWARDLREQCLDQPTPFLFKQWGAWVRWEPGLSASDVIYLKGDGTQHREPIGAGASGVAMVKVGKHAAGRILDHRTWDEIPEPPPGWGKMVEA